MIRISLISILLISSLIFSCQNDSLKKRFIDSEYDEEVLDSLNFIGYKPYQDEWELPLGINDTIILGYTDRTKGIYYRKELKLESLEIKGIFLRKEDSKWKENLYLYRFEFSSENEERLFEKFQSLCLNYQGHGKNQVEFFKKGIHWYLSFAPMP